MKILLKRNSSNTSQIPSMSAGEPIWFKDKLYIGSVGTSAGGTQTAGERIFIGPYTGDNGIQVDSEGLFTHVNSGKEQSSGLYKITVDNAGHVIAATAVVKSDITALGIPGTDTNTHLAHTITFTNATASDPEGDSVSVITDIPKFTTSSTDGKGTANPNTVNVPTKAYVDESIATLRTEVGNPMVFKGSLGTGGTTTTLPQSPGVGYTYKVITETEIPSIGTAMVGDTIIYTSNGWVIIPSGDEPSGTVTSVGLSVPTGLTVSGSPITSSGTLAITLSSGYKIPQTTELYSYKTIKGDTTASTAAGSIGDTLTIAGTAPISTVATTDKITISHDDSTVTAASYPATASSTSQLNYTSTFNVPTFTVDSKGHLTAAGSVTYKIPASDNTDTKVTAVGNHYTPTGGTTLTPTVSSTGNYALGTEYEVVTGVTITKDAAGHITGASVTKQKIKDTNTDTNDTYSFSTTATNGKFSVTNSGSSHSVTLTEIDGGTF